MGKCKNDDCQNETYLYDEPNVYTFKIPFTQIEIQIWDWSGKTKSELCEECFMDSYNNSDRKEREALIEYGYQAGYEDCSRGK